MVYHIYGLSFYGIMAIIRIDGKRRDVMNRLHHEIIDCILKHGKDIIREEGFQKGKTFRHHGDLSVYRHTLCVTYMSVYVVRRFGFKVDERTLVRGALLHDYYLYDWHEKDKSHRLHGFHHAHTARVNAGKRFALTPKEIDIIERHMFPLNHKPPGCREAWIVCLMDKWCAALDYLPIPS